MRSEFDTLEQYQESMKEFNENTRMGFEEFIQSHGSDRNKLQLRCTPYTSKKGGYGSFDLDFGLCVYQHQQSKVDELQKQLIEQGQRFNVQTQQIASLKWQLKRLGYTDNGGELMKPPIGDAPKFDLLDELQKRVDELHTAFKQLIEMENESISFEHDLFDKGWNQSARQTIENIYKLTGLGEQALKGGDQNTEKQPNNHAENIATKGVKGGDQ